MKPYLLIFFVWQHACRMPVLPEYEKIMCLKRLPFRIKYVSLQRETRVRMDEMFCADTTLNLSILLA